VLTEPVETFQQAMSPKVRLLAPAPGDTVEG
jgi:hypothetical protein